ncbi:uncharacterized PE-PGRS family protein PE_PGRS54-like [Plodia interpunctella]|uniref:uncharacterized PE-PGRS family protein PE_PGRS54-like n=1 Tax=Plodia interpunctella TaxID=58824 RepID=UPI00236859B0|nr:uncharacterized PE-PGRS family protein PE_PGRS54-like [Plodia interpunctella]
MPRHTPPHTTSSARPRIPFLCIVFALLSQAHSLPTALAPASTKQLYVVCKNLDSNICITWLLDVQNDKKLSNELTPFNRPSQICGLSDLKPIPPHRKFISITPLESTKHFTVFCQVIKAVTEEAFDLTDFTRPFTSLYRQRRQAYGLRGRYRGQTQSQYLAIDRGNGKDEGKAEAHSAADSSRASVSGNSGMGQAQSQTIYDPSCEECYDGRSDMEASNLRRPQPDIYGYGRGPSSPGGAGMTGQGLSDHGGGSKVPGYVGTGGQRIPGHNGIDGHMPPSQIGGQGLPGHGGVGGQRMPGQGGSNGQENGQTRGRPDQGGVNGQEIPRQGGINGQGGLNGQGVAGHGGIGSQGIPGQGGIGGQRIPGQGSMGGQGTPGEGGINGQGIPGQGGINGHGIPGQGGINGHGIPGQGGINGQGIPGQGGINGQGTPGQGGINGHGIPGQGGINGHGIPGQGGINGQGIPGQGGINGQGIPGQGGINGQGTPGQGGINGQGTPGQGGINGQGTPGQDGIGGQRIPGQGGINGQGIPGQGGINGQGIPGHGGMNGQGIRGQGGINGQIIPGQVGINGQRIPGQGGIGGQIIPGQGGMRDQRIPGQGGIGGQGIPGQGGMNGQGVPGHGGIGGQGIPGQTGVDGQGIPGHSGIGGQGGYNGQGRQPQTGDLGQVGITGTGFPHQGGNGGLITPSHNIQKTPAGGYPSYHTSIIPSGNWPLASGPIRGADGLLYYCCVVNPNQVSGLNTGGIQQTPGYGQTNGARQNTGGSGQESQYPSYNYGSSRTDQPNPTGLQTSYGNIHPSPTYNYGTADVHPNQYGETGGHSTGNNLQSPTNKYDNGGNGQGRPYPYGSSVGSQSNQNGPYGQESAGPIDNRQQGPNYYRPGGVQISPDGTYGSSQTPTGTTQPTARGKGNQYGPDYTYGSGRPDQPSIPGFYGQTGGSEIPYGSGGTGQQSPVVGGQPTVYSQDGNGQQLIPGYNYGSGKSVNGPTNSDSQLYGGTGSQSQYGGPSGNGQLSPTYTNGGGNGQPNVGGTYGQRNGPNASGGTGQQNTYGQGGNGQQGPGYTYSQGDIDRPKNGVTYGQSGVEPQSTYDYGTNAQKGPDSSYGSGGSNPSGTYDQSIGPQTPGGIGLQNYYPDSGNGQQGYANNNPDYGGNNQGPTNINGYEQPQAAGQNTNYGGVPQNVMEPNSIIEEDDDSQALASVYQGLNGTTASASSQGGNEKGHAQTNVQGTYTDTGSFSAQASISDDNKGAESQVSGSKKGATSNAEGRGRKNKSQAAVKLGSETGSIQTESQSGGNMHSSNTQVQGSVKGGVADAQARGPGSTSSQAQIGFTPYKEGDKAHEIMKTPFEGGGTASAQSSGRMGTSQSQLRGTFKYGITYNGAAQAGASLDKDAVFSNFTSFDKIDVFDQNNTNINVNVENTDKPLDSSTTYEGLEKNEENTIQESNISYNGHSHYDHHKPKEEVNTTNIIPLPSNRRSFSSTYDNNNNNNGGDYDYNVDDTPTDEYDVEEVPEGVDNIPNEYANYDNYGRETENTHQSQRQHSTSRKGLEVKQSTGGSTQHILIGSLKNQDAKITQIKSERPDESKVYQPGERVPGMGGYTIPAGFTGSVKSVSSKEKTYVVGTKHSPSQAQTVTLTPGSGKVKYSYPEYYGRNNINPKDLRSLYNPRADDNRYVSVSKSVTRDLDSENNIRKQYSHTYYTKSSSCGYFTFTCTMVSSAEGKKKVCRPKIPTNPDGTPMRC